MDYLDIYDKYNQDDDGTTSIKNGGLGLNTPDEKASMGRYKKPVPKGGTPKKKTPITNYTPDKLFTPADANKQNPGYNDRK